MTKEELKRLHQQLSVGVLIAAILLSFYAAWVIVQLWAWFAVPLFEVPPLSIALVFGLRALLSLLAPQTWTPTTTPTTADAAYEQAVNRIAALVIAPTFALIIGAIARGFV